MHWLQTLDGDLFHFVNTTMRNEVFDQLMPFASGNILFFPAVLIVGLTILWRGGARAWICLLMFAIILPLGDGLVTNTIKHAVARDRPFLVVPDVHLLGGRTGSGSMPSSHAANWFAATFIAFIYYRRTLWFMLPCAVLVALSRIYNGVHYPSDVVAGAILGAGYAAAGLWLLNTIWNWVGRKWFPLWWEKLPSLLNPRLRPELAEEGDVVEMEEAVTSKTAAAYSASSLPPARTTVLPRTRGIAPEGFVPPQVNIDVHWLRLCYLLIVLLLVVRWVYIAGHTIQLAEDEAYQWLWSKHLALSYYSKPPLIAYAQFIGTWIWGDTAFGIRFLSPLISSVVSLLVLRFFAREVNARAGFFLVLMFNAMPLLAVGAVLMTVDPLSVLFWTTAMLAGWRAVQENSTAWDWFWVGIWMGLGFLSKYTELLQLICWIVFFAIWKPARKQLRRPGPYLALLVNAVCTLPVLIWNHQHGWITATHVAQDAGIKDVWHPTLKPLLDFIGTEFLLFNPVFSVAIIWACIALWRRDRHNPRLVYCFSMGAPLFLIFLLWSLRSRILPNWIAPSVVPLLCLAVIYWDARGRLGTVNLKPWLMAGLMFGGVLVVFGYNTNLVQKVANIYLPVKLDPLHRVREWDTTARVVGQARSALLSEGKPVFIITDHYGMAGQISFYLPEAKAAVSQTPLVYFRSTAVPENQFYFWPGYSERKGENAVFVRELDRSNPEPTKPPDSIVAEFESVTDMGISNVLYHDRFLLRPLQFFACRGLK